MTKELTELQRAAAPLEPVAWRYKSSRGLWRYVGPRGLDEHSARILKPEPLFAAAPPVLHRALISDDTLEMLYGCVAWCLDRHDEDSEVYRNRARAILSAANRPKGMT